MSIKDDQFVCDDCGSEVTSVVHDVKNSKFYCKPCSAKLSTKTCGKCKGPIVGQYMTSASIPDHTGVVCMSCYLKMIKSPKEEV